MIRNRRLDGSGIEGGPERFRQDGRTGDRDLIPVGGLLATTSTLARGPIFGVPLSMRRHPHRRILGWLAFGLLIAGVAPVLAADVEINHLLQSPVAKDWVTNGGNLTNQRYSTLKQIDTTNVKQLKGAWMTRLKRSGFGTKYSAEATPLVRDGIMYMVTGNDDVFALNAKTREILWQR